MASNADALVSMARARFGALTRAEELMFRRSAEGDRANCAPNEDMSDEANDPSKAEGWGKDRTIGGDRVRWLCANPAARALVDPLGINIYGARIGAPGISLVDLPFGLQFERCRLEGDIQLRDARLRLFSAQGSWGKSLEAARLICGSVILGNSRWEGGVWLDRGVLNGDLDCSNIWIANPARKGVDGSGIAIRAEGITVSGGVFLGAAHIEGGVDLSAARIAGSLECDQASLSNGPVEGAGNSGVALELQHGAVNASVHLRQAQALGIVSLMGATIGGNVECSGSFRSGGAKWVGGAEVELLLANATVKGNAYFDGASVAGGRVAFNGATIERALSLQGDFKDVAVDLADVHVGTLDDGGEQGGHWPRKGNLFVDGLVYGRILPAPSAEERLKWLRLDGGEFSTQPYEQLAKLLKGLGDESGASAVLIEMEHRRRRSSAFNFLLEKTSGYGYDPQRALLPLLGLYSLGWILYRRSYLAGRMTPSEREAYEVFKKEGQPPAHYPRFSPSVYSLENCFPLVKLGQGDKWQPDPTPDEAATDALFSFGKIRPWRGPVWLERAAIALGLRADVSGREKRWARAGTSSRWMRRLLWAQILLGWLLATLVAYGVAGAIAKG